MPVATEIRLRTGPSAYCEVAFDDGSSVRLSGRVSCAWRARAPRCRATDRTRRRSSPASRHVGIIAIEPVGNYAVRLVFDDLHDTGIYSWDYLHELGREQDRLWQAYLAALDARGLSRDPG